MFLKEPSLSKSCSVRKNKTTIFLLLLIFIQCLVIQIKFAYSGDRIDKTLFPPYLFATIYCGMQSFIMCMYLIVIKHTHKKYEWYVCYLIPIIYGSIRIILTLAATYFFLTKADVNVIGILFLINGAIEIVGFLIVVGAIAVIAVISFVKCCVIECYAKSCNGYDGIV